MRKSTLLSAFLFTTSAAALSPRVAFANGQTTHVWITKEAVDVLPDGELKAFLARPELRQMLLNGAMFPDGGYAMKSPYGEAAHWDPFRSAVKDGILADASAGFDRGTEERLAFLFGLASHGIADELHDATFMERSKEFDHWSDADFDTAMDVVFAADGHAQSPPGVWAPLPSLAGAFAKSEGLSINLATMLTGQTLLQGAIAGVTTLAFTPFVASSYRRQYPWAASSLGNGNILGSPPSEAHAVARYWEQLWARTHGTGPSMDSPLLNVYNASSGAMVAASASTTDSRLVLLFREGLRANSVTTDHIYVEASDGRRLPVRLNLFYGNTSHTVLVIPEADWPVGEDLTLVVAGGGVVSFEGAAPSANTRHTFRATR
jgi:hypothetical protein